MSILQEIHKWSQAQPAWQQDAIRRLYVDRILSGPDIDDLYALAKAEHGVEDPDGRTPAKLADADLAAPPVPDRLVQIAYSTQIGQPVHGKVDSRRVATRGLFFYT